MFCFVHIILYKIDFVKFLCGRLSDSRTTISCSLFAARPQRFASPQKLRFSVASGRSDAGGFAVHPEAVNSFGVHWSALALKAVTR